MSPAKFSGAVVAGGGAESDDEEGETTSVTM